MFLLRLKDLLSTMLKIGWYFMEICNTIEFSIRSAQGYLLNYAYLEFDRDFVLAVDLGRKI